MARSTPFPPQVSVRSEVAQSLDPVRRLPQMLAAYLPSAGTGGGAISGEWMDAMPAADEGGAIGGGGGAALQAAVSAAVVAEVDAAVAKILSAQSEGFARLAQVIQECGRRRCVRRRLVMAQMSGQGGCGHKELQVKLKFEPKLWRAFLPSFPRGNRESVVVTHIAP
eukprot:360927-Chlamydomonas_euryale.AAC.4